MSATAIQITNEAGGVVDEEFSGAFQELARLELGECAANTKVTEVGGLATILLASGVTLTASFGT